MLVSVRQPACQVARSYGKKNKAEKGSGARESEAVIFQQGASRASLERWHLGRNFPEEEKAGVELGRGEPGVV